MNEIACDSPDDPLSTAIVIGECDVDSTKGQARRDTHSAALDAKAKGDLDGVFAAYRASVEERAKLEKLWLGVLATTTSKESHDLARELADVASPVEAIRDVALAAIQLVEKVALKEDPT